MKPLVIEQGSVEGSELSGVHAFLGMPYARAPIGDRRWQPPQPPDAWEGVREATHFGPACLQKGGTSFDLRVQEQSEDCLFLNVWTSTLDREAHHPVTVWIPGALPQRDNHGGPTRLHDQHLAVTHQWRARSTLAL